jgi:hypothetical protein
MGLLFAGIGPMLGVAYFNRLGDFAKSPQRLEMSVGSTSFVAGGRAKIWFSSIQTGPEIEISCKDQTKMLQLETSEPSDEVCGIRVRKLELFEKDLAGHPQIRAVFEVTWQEK